MFSENDRISQRQMERQIVLVLLCPAFWQLAAYGASDGLPGMAGIFVGYGLLAVWCIYLVRLGGLYCRLESVMGKAGKLLLAVICWVSRFSILSLVPIGTVDLITTTQSVSRVWAIWSITVYTYFRFAEPSFFSGVPTPTKMAWAS